MSKDSGLARWKVGGNSDLGLVLVELDREGKKTLLEYQLTPDKAIDIATAMLVAAQEAKYGKHMFIVPDDKDITE